jgi:Holliday junction resolvasome RuvABC endonuclease subunit
MTATIPRKPLTFAIHPNTRGFGWVAFEGPFTPHDWGIVTIDRDKNTQCLARIEEMLATFLPDTLVIEAFEGSNPARGERIIRLCRGIVSLAADRGVDVAIYTKDQVRACFAYVGARTRHEIARAVARHVEALNHQLPKLRRAWESEDRRMALFSAAALVLAHFQLDATGLLDQLGGLG